MSSNENNIPSKNQGHANLHIPSFLELDAADNSQVQVVTNGKELTAENLLKQTNGLTLTQPILITDTPESIGMKVLQYPNRQVKVSDIAAILGGAHPVDVIDVEHQDELDGWTLGDLVDYFEDPYRQKSGRNEDESPTKSSSDTSTPKRRQRRAAAKALEMKANQRPRVLNQISLEFSNTALREKISSPQFVRDLDWIDHAWPGRSNGKNTLIYPAVQYYCLTSAAGCYTDFHVDFGGTSVWYHVMSGQKEFCLIAPTEANLEVFEKWNCSPNQATTFLPKLIEDPSTIIRITLQASQTMIIPSAWIHGVYTPTDSVVLGGNFLHGLDIQNQLEVYDIEERTRVRERFRFPLYKQLHFYAGGMYLNKLRRGDISRLELKGCDVLHETLLSWWEDFREEVPLTPPGQAPNISAAALEAARANNCYSVDMLLYELKTEHYRVTQNGICPNEKYKNTLSEPQERPKLKLKLKPSDNTTPPEVPKPQSTVSNVESVISQAAEMPKKIRLKLKTDTGPSAEETSSDPFRIVLSSTAVPKKAKTKFFKRVREDTEWYDEGPEPEDEWMPSKKKSNKKKNKSSTSRGNQGTKSSGSSSTVRSRLMSRFR